MPNSVLFNLFVKKKRKNPLPSKKPTINAFILATTATSYLQSQEISSKENQNLACWCHCDPSAARLYFFPKVDGGAIAIICTYHSFQRV